MKELQVEADGSKALDASVPVETIDVAEPIPEQHEADVTTQVVSTTTDTGATPIQEQQVDGESLRAPSNVPTATKQNGGIESAEAQRDTSDVSMRPAEKKRLHWTGKTCESA